MADQTTTGLRFRGLDATFAGGVIIAGDEDRITAEGGSMYLGGGNGNTTLVQFSGHSIPDQDSSKDLGTTNRYWRHAYIDAMTTTGNATFGGRIIVNGIDATFNPDGDSSAAIKNAGTNAIALFAASGDTLYLGGNNTTAVYLDNSADAYFVGNVNIVNNKGIELSDRYQKISFQLPYFTHNTSNLAADIQLPNEYINGVLELRLQSGYSYANAAGEAYFKWVVGLNPNGSVWYTPSLIERHITVNNANQIFVDDPVWDSSASKYRIRVYHKNDQGNQWEGTLTLTSQGGGTIDGAIAISNLLTSTSTTNTHPIGKYYRDPVRIKTAAYHTANTAADELVIGDGTGHHGITIHTGTTHQGSIYFADDLDAEAAGDNPVGNRDGVFRYSQNDGHFQFRTAGNQQALTVKHNASTFEGNLTVGTGNLTLSGNGTITTGGYWHIASAANGNGYLDAGGTIYIRDKDDGNADKITIDTATGNTAFAGATHTDGIVRSRKNIVSNSTYNVISLNSSRSIDDYGGLNKDYMKIDLVTPGPNTDGGGSAHGFGAFSLKLANNGANTNFNEVLNIAAGGTATFLNNVDATNFRSKANSSYSFTPNTTNKWQLNTPSGYIRMGPGNTSYAHIETDRAQFYLNKPLVVNGGEITSYDENFVLRRANSNATFSLGEDSNATNDGWAVLKVGEKKGFFMQNGSQFLTNYLHSVRTDAASPTHTAYYQWYTIKNPAGYSSNGLASSFKVKIYTAGKHANGSCYAEYLVRCHNANHQATSGLGNTEVFQLFKSGRGDGYGGSTQDLNWYVRNNLSGWNNGEIIFRVGRANREPIDTIKIEPIGADTSTDWMPTLVSHGGGTGANDGRPTTDIQEITMQYAGLERTGTAGAKLKIETNGGANGTAHEIARFINRNSNGYSSYFYIGSTSGTDWRLGKNILGASSGSNFEIATHSGTTKALEINSSNLFTTFAGAGQFDTSLKINAPDGGGSPAMTAIINMHGYEGRGVGIKMRDNVNSASSPSDREWFVGTGYNTSGFNIGYASDGVSSSYAAQAKFSITTAGNATFTGTTKATTFLVNRTTAAGVGASLGDINGAELGPGYLSLSRDDTAAAKQIVFEKNDTEHSYIETASSELKFVSSNGSDISWYNGSTRIMELDTNASEPVLAIGPSVAADDTKGTLQVFGSNNTDGTVRLGPHSSKGSNFSHIHYGSTGDWYIRPAGNTGKIQIADNATTQTVNVGNINGSFKFNVAGGIYASGSSQIASDGYDVLKVSGAGSTSGPTMEIKTSGATSGADSLDIYQANTIYGPKAIRFFYGSTSTSAVDGITVTSSAVNYGTGSDYRLKENIVELTGALDRVDNLKPKRFNFINNPDVTVDGFLAHEAQEVIPQAVTGEKDMEIDGKPYYQGIDHGFIVPLLTAAIKELKAQNEDLLNRVKALESK